VPIPHRFVTFPPEPGGYMRFLKYRFGLLTASSRGFLEVTKNQNNNRSTHVDRPVELR
jgi:hypothetical protein